MLYEYLCAVEEDRRCDPEEGNWCDEDFYCDARNKPGVCLSKDVAESKITKKRGGLYELEHEGHKIMGTKTALAKLEKLLKSLIRPPRPSLLSLKALKALRERKLPPIIPSRKLVFEEEEKEEEEEEIIKISELKPIPYIRRERKHERVIKEREEKEREVKEREVEEKEEKEFKVKDIERVLEEIQKGDDTQLRELGAVQKQVLKCLGLIET